MNEFEDRLTGALKTSLQDVNEHTVHNACLPAPAAPVRHRAVLAAAAAVVAVVFAVTIGVQAHRGSDSPASSGAPTTAAHGSDRLEVQGAVIPIPKGWHAVDASVIEADITNPYRYCVLPEGNKLLPRGCLGSGGIMIRLARASTSGAATPVQGSFQSDCRGETVPIQENGTIGGGPAIKARITCGKNPASSSTYWATTDRTLTIQTPFNGKQSLPVATAMVQHIDLRHWQHTIPTKPRDQTTTGSTR